MNKGETEYLEFQYYLIKQLSMKKINLIAITLFAASAVISSLAFIKKPNPGSPIYYYDTSVGLTRNISAGTQTLMQNEIRESANWITDLQGSVCGGSYLGGMIFNWEANNDGNSDGQLSLQEAADAVWSYYAAHSYDLPNHLVSFPVGSAGASITILRRSN
jgi:hypothetical protein